MSVSRREFLRIGGIIAVRILVGCDTTTPTPESYETLLGEVVTTSAFIMENADNGEKYQFNISYRTHANVSLNPYMVENLASLFYKMEGRLPKNTWIDFTDNKLPAPSSPGAMSTTFADTDHIVVSLAVAKDIAYFFTPEEHLNGAVAAELANHMFREGNLLEVFDMEATADRMDIQFAGDSIGVMVSYITKGYDYQQYINSVNVDVTYPLGDFLTFDEKFYNNVSRRLTEKLVVWN